MKIVVTVGTRPEIIRLSCIIKSLNESNLFDLTLVHTGQNYDFELSEIFFHDLGLPYPNYFLEANSQTPVETVGKSLIEIDRVLEEIKPDVYLVLGDTNSCLTSYAAKRRKIPVFHMEAGNRCFDENVPEEINRKIVDSIADINLTYSQEAKDYLIKEGHNPQTCIVVGSPMYEVVNCFKDDLSKNVLLEHGLEVNKYFLLSLHRDENVSDLNSIKNVLLAVTDLMEEYNSKCIFSVHPRTKKQLEKLNTDKKDIIFSKPLGYKDYLSLQLYSKLVLSDSGTINEESDILGFKAINLRNTNERPEASNYCVVPMSGLDKEYIKKTVHYILTRDFQSNLVYAYNRSNVSKVVLSNLISMTQYVNYYKWRK